MAAEGSQRGLKRLLEDNDQLCLAKVRRQDLDHDVGSGDVCGGGPGIATSDSVHAVADFDCTSLSQALQSEEFQVPENIMEAPPADVYVPGSASYARISWDCMLAQISKRLSLKLHDSGYVHVEGSGVEAWICIDIPVKGVMPTKRIERFIGGRSHYRHCAVESACKAAVRFLRSSCDVIVLDANYADLKAMERRARRAEDFSSMYLDMIVARDKREEVMHGRYASVIASAKNLCKEFGDILPVRADDVGGSLTGAKEVEMMYAGPRPPTTRIDEFTFALVSLLKRGSGLGGASRTAM